MEINLARQDDENERQYIWRLASAKDSGVLNMDWEQLASVFNKELKDEDNEYTSSAYRKPYQQAKAYYDDVFSKMISNQYSDDLMEQKQSIIRETIKLRDERNALYARYREIARNEADLDILKTKISNSGSVSLIPHYSSISSEKDMFVSLSDVHYGATNDSYFGSYDSEITKLRMEEYLGKVIELQKLHNAKNCYVGLLGDLINSNIHVSLQITNRENVIEQIQGCSELLSLFVYELSNVFENVYINSVSGNHTRLTKKEDSLRNERTDDLIPWYMQAKLEHIKNIHFISKDNNYDSTIASITIREKEYLMVHGDWDSYGESGVSKLLLMTKANPEGIFYGHLHKCSYDDIAGIKIVRSGSFSGTGDDYCISKRIKGVASQMICVCTKDGIEACYPITLM